MDFHNRRIIRLPHHDYRQPASYFITINVKLGQCLFGRASSSTEIQLNELGQIAKDCWLEIPNHFPQVQPDEFVIMPNHVHGIIHILEQAPNEGTHDPEKRANIRTQPIARAWHAVALPPSTPNRFGPLPKGSLGVIIGQYKAAVTRWANENSYGGLFNWHSRYFERIIKDEAALNAVRIYIRQNPAKWWEKYNNTSW